MSWDNFNDLNMDIGFKLLWFYGIQSDDRGEGGCARHPFFGYVKFIHEAEFERKEEEMIQKERRRSRKPNVTLGNTA